jgi:hypothetical protein
MQQVVVCGVVDPAFDWDCVVCFPLDKRGGVGEIDGWSQREGLDWVDKGKANWG